MIKGKERKKAINWTDPGRIVRAEFNAPGFAAMVVVVSRLRVELVVIVFGGLTVAKRGLVDGVMMGSFREVPVVVPVAGFTSNVELVVVVVVIVTWPGGIITGGGAVPEQILPMGQQPPPVQHTVL